MNTEQKNFLKTITLIECRKKLNYFENSVPEMLSILVYLKNLVSKAATHSCDIKTFLIMPLLLLYGSYCLVYL